MEHAKGLPRFASLTSLRLLVLSTRPKQWTKNLLIYFAFFFSLNQNWDPSKLRELAVLFSQATGGFAVFCALSGAVYLFNDLMDMERDRAHPQKRTRPLAAGQLHPALAIAGAVALAAGGLGGAFLLGSWLGGVGFLYLALMAAYSLGLKRLVLLDVMAISAGFVLRAAAGAVAISVPISPWLYLTTSLGALFIGFGKRRNELHLAGGQGEQQRDALRDYSAPLLDQLLALAASSTLLAYMLYTFFAPNLPANNTMMLTIPFVMYGLFRYLFLIYRRNMGEDPEDIFLADLPLIAAILLWLATATSLLLLSSMA